MLIAQFFSSFCSNESLNLFTVFEFFDINEEEFLTNFFSDQVAKILYKESNCDNILKVAEEKIKYIKTKSLTQGDLNFDNE